MKKLSFILVFALSFLLFSYSVYAVTLEDLLNYFYSLFTSVSNAIIGGITPAISCVYGTATATYGVTYGNYKVYSDIGSNGNWSRIVIKDSVGNTVDTRIINQGESWDFSSAGLTVSIFKVRALLDGTIVGVDLAVSSIGVYCPVTTTTTILHTTTTTTTIPTTTTTTIAPICGNKICESGETQYTCCYDCGCAQGYSCAVEAKSIITATNAAAFGTWRVYATIGSNNAWARIVIKDSIGRTFDDMIIYQNSSRESNNTGLTVKVISVKALLDGTVVGANVTVWSTGITGVATATTPVAYGNYLVYSTQGVTGSWAKIVIKYQDGRILDSFIINQGDTRDSSITGLSIKVLAVRALQDGTVVGVDLNVNDIRLKFQCVGVYQPTTTTTKPTTTTITPCPRTCCPPNCPPGCPIWCPPTTTTIPSKNCKDNNGVCILSILGYGTCPRGYSSANLICPYSWITKCCIPS